MADAPRAGPDRCHPPPSSLATPSLHRLQLLHPGRCRALRSTLARTGETAEVAEVETDDVVGRVAVHDHYDDSDEDADETLGEQVEVRLAAPRGAVECTFDVTRSLARCQHSQGVRIRRPGPVHGFCIRRVLGEEVSGLLEAFPD